MNKNNLLVMGVDFGTQSVRVGIYNCFGKLIISESNGYNTIFPEIGWAEQDPNEWWSAFKNLLSKIIKKVESKNIKGLVICGTSSTVLAVDESGIPLMNAILWMDTRSKTYAEKINKKQHPILKLCGGEVSPEWMVPKSLWIKEEKNNLYEKAFKIVEQIDWINFKLTGKWAASVCNTTCKWNLNLNKKFDLDFLNSIDLNDILNKWPNNIKNVGEPIGNISHQASLELGLNQEIIVFEGGIDAYIGMFGMGVGEKHKLSLTMGTSFVQLAFVDKHTYSKSLWGPYKDVLIDGYWVLEGGQISGASLIEWFKDELAGNCSENINIFDFIADKGTKIQPGCNGVIALDFFQGNRTPYKDPFAKGIFYGLTLKHNKWHMYRALLEATAFGNLNNIIELELAGCKIDEILVSGGAIKHNLWPQIVADVCDKQIKVPKNLNPGILGCAIVALKSLGYYDTYQNACEEIVKIEKIISPNKENNKVYQHIFKKYLYLYERLKELMHS